MIAPGGDRQDANDEGPPGVSRVEAFSDGVIAIIVTIMVLELHPPISEGMDRLVTLWPVFLAYVLSYAYVAIYWVNHHRLFGYATHVSNALIWANMLLLFALSLVPFSTSYLGEHHLNRAATWLYLATMLVPALAYTWLQATVRRTGRQGPNARAYYNAMQRKSLFALGVYLTGVALTFVSPALGIGCAALVAVFWVLPSGPIDRLFADRGGQGPQDRDR